MRSNVDENFVLECGRLSLLPSKTCEVI